ncbi:MAG: ABC transporter permease, partial [Gemmatimonadales bacterium]
DRAIEVSARRAVGASRRLAAASWPGSLGDGTPVPTVMVVCGLALVAVLCAMLPLIFARQRRIEDAPRRPLRLAIPALQLGMSLVVLTGGALLARHASDTIPRSGSHAAAGEVFRQTDPDAAPAARASRYAALLDQLAAGGRFDTVSLTTAGALVGLGMVSAVTTDCGECSEGGIFLPWHIVPATHQFVSADTFHALGVRLLAGRGITSRDRWGTEPVAVVSRGLALRHFQRGEALGRKILLGDDHRTWHTVVGIVDDPPLRGVGAALQPPFTVYASVLQHPVPTTELLVRAKGSTAVDATTVASVGRALVSGGRPPTSMTEAEMLATNARPLAWFSRWFSLEGWTMLVLACGGTFALMRLWVLSLLAELGLRRALGARKWQLVRFVLLRAAAVGLAGVAVGVWFGPAVWSALASGTAGVPVWHAPTVMRFALLLIVTAVAGALLPALRAARGAPARLLSWT